LNLGGNNTRTKTYQVDKNIEMGWRIPARQEYFMNAKCKETELYECLLIIKWGGSLIHFIVSF